MGYIKHNAIVVTGQRKRDLPNWDREDCEIDDAHRAAKECGCAVTDIVGPLMNGSLSFLVVPDGSKEGWVDSDAGDEARDRFVRWLDKVNGEHGGWFEWVEVWFGNDDADAGIVRHAHTAVDREADRA